MRSWWDVPVVIYLRRSGHRSGSCSRARLPPQSESAGVAATESESWTSDRTPCRWGLAAGAGAGGRPSPWPTQTPYHTCCRWTLLCPGGSACDWIDWTGGGTPCHIGHTGRRCAPGGCAGATAARLWFWRWRRTGNRCVFWWGGALGGRALGGGALPRDHQVECAGSQFQLSLRLNRKTYWYAGDGSPVDSSGGRSIQIST